LTGRTSPRAKAWLRAGALVLLALALLPGLALAQNRPRPAPARPPAVAAEPLPPLPPAPVAPPVVTLAPLPPPLPPVQRRITLEEMGLPAGLVFDGAGREIGFPLPRGFVLPGARLGFVVELASAFPGRQGVEITVNGRLLGALPFEEGETRMAFEAAVTAEDLARNPAALRVGLRLVEQPPGGARASLLAGSHLAFALPAEPPNVEALLALMPPRLLLLLPPGPVPAAEAAATLRLALALAETGRTLRLAAGPPPVPLAPIPNRIWETGAVLLGAATAGEPVRRLGEVPVLALTWEEVPALAAALERRGAGSAEALPFASLAGSLVAQEAARAAWSLGFTAHELPPGTRPEALEVALHAPPGSRATASVALNGVVLGASLLPPDGRARLLLPIPPRLPAFENRIDVTLHRQEGPGGPAQLLPESLLRLGPAGPPAEFLDLPPRFAAGLQVVLEAPGGQLPLEALEPALWLLRRMAPPGTPLRVTAQDPAQPARPAGPFLAITRLPPAGSAPWLRLEDGSVVVAETARGRPPLQPDAVERGYLAQLVSAGGQPGLWLRPPSLPVLLPAAPPALDRGDIALLDGRGVALALMLAPPPPIPPPAVLAPAAPAAEAPRSLVQAWRPFVAGLLWLLGVTLVVHAFRHPRQVWRPSMLPPYPAPR
jgi:hypothetical protein